MNEKTMETITVEERAAHIIDMFHRMTVHHTLWFREAEHQLGFEKALNVMDYAWRQTRKAAVRRLAAQFHFPEKEGCPAFLIRLPKEEQLSLLDTIAKSWLAQDGFWFQGVEFSYGINDAKRCNDSTWARFSPLEAHSIKKLLGMEKHPGLEGLAQALNFRMYSRLNRQSSRFEDGSLIFTMDNCRVQSARMRKNLPDYPCKSAGLVEYAHFAEGIDDRIQTECIGCPPDAHPESWFCAWKFTLK